MKTRGIKPWKGSVQSPCSPLLPRQHKAHGMIAEVNSWDPGSYCLKFPFYSRGVLTPIFPQLGERGTKPSWDWV